MPEISLFGGIRITMYRDDNDYMMAKSRNAFRRAALRRSKTARRFAPPVGQSAAVFFLLGELSP